MNLFRPISLLAATSTLAVVLAGCSSADAESPSASESSATASPSKSLPPSPSPSSTDLWTEPANCLSKEQALDVLWATDEQTEAGFTERYFLEDGSEWVLILNPAQEDDYTAAWFDVSNGEGELVFDGLTFSYSFALTTLLQASGDSENDEFMFSNPSFRCEEGGFSVSVSSPGDYDFGYRFLVGPDGLLESAIGLDNGKEYGLSIDYEYSVEQRWLEGLDALANELLGQS